MSLLDRLPPPHHSPEGNWVLGQVARSRTKNQSRGKLPEQLNQGRMESKQEQTLVEFVIKWNGKEIPVSIEQDATVADLKRMLEGLTNVLSTKQKVLGLKAKGKPATEEVCLCMQRALLTDPYLLSRLRWENSLWPKEPRL